MKLFGGLPEEDLEELSSSWSSNFDELRDVNFIVVGASGFLGKWITGYLVYLQKHSYYQQTISLIVRNPKKLLNLKDVLQTPSCKVITTDTLKNENFSYISSKSRIVIIYAATSTLKSGLKSNIQQKDLLDLPDTLIETLPNLHTTFVHLSSGGIYEPKSRLLAAIPQNYEVQLQSTDSYIQEKLQLEHWSQVKSQANHFVARNPRLFAFYGPGLQLDRHFAIGQFMRQAKNNLPIQILGNPSNLRSYLYPSDAVSQILNQCLIRDPIHKQIGSGIPRSLLSVARVIAKEYGVNINIVNNTTESQNNYVPIDVPLNELVELGDGISKWAKWLKIMNA